MISLMWNLKNNKMNVYAKQKQTHKYSKQTNDYQREEGRGAQIRGMVLTDTNYYV